MAAAISRRALGQAVAARLAPLSTATQDDGRWVGTTGYYGQVGAMHGLPAATDGDRLAVPDDPPTKAPDDPRVRPYFVVFPGIGAPADDQALCAEDFDLDWPVSITAAAGDIDDLLALVDRLEARLVGWSPGVLGTAPDVVLTGRLRRPVGFTPAALLDRTVTPWRPFASLQLLLTAHT